MSTEYDLRTPPPRSATDPRPDPVLALMARVTPFLLRQSARRKRREPVPVDRSLRLVVTEVRHEAEDVVSLRFAAADGGPLPGWHPGAHLDLDLPSGRRRQYSLCGDPTDLTTYRIAVRRIEKGDGGSREIHEQLSAGAELRAHGPRNAFAYAPGGACLFIAGGIGITPILPMVQAAAAMGADWRLVYTGRSRATLPFLDEIDAIETAGGAPARVTVRTDDADGVPTPDLLLAGAGPGTSVYFCGPPPLIAALRDAFPATGATGLHFERFSAAPVVDGTPFEIRLGPDGPVLPVPADRSALSVLAEQRPETGYSCRQGFCGTCRLPVLTGEVAHAGSVAARRSDTNMLICVSRSATSGGRITLDV
ncbi:PDR/VanB family oxidoreductase [Streptomyces sp. H10-C2]|uniref:PDR/VanB family oxidoreductase n=1 Tax=unclassified Streptomyces TaxID=2593676 RepID=UPI0024BA7867|nr:MULTISPECIES: PDR/VanB family oxidoreductase [unclassified Streptomyces]MDJ0344000.1 PDR/VanB family oxidoreductase [Streptomyces sp. PH10-H1]MDJ0373509.1 PDR/VanB family oxidoreductase [Streptomyces sp. H10-C2]